MQIIDINLAQPQLAALIQSAVAGEDVIISKEDGVMVRLMPVVDTAGKRVGGQLRGQFHLSDDFGECDKEIEDLFYNSKIFPEA
jgi:antitoxin (DNA-binding transcriptional repressor) of toxin-antitoxin stability system